MPEYINKIRTSSGDLPVNYEALANLPTISNPNLLINSDFRKPINQRGQTTYKSDANNFTRVFTIDRWNMQNGCKCVVNSGSITLSGDSAANGVGIFCQVLETLPKDNYTLQVKVKSISNGAEVSITNSSSQTVFNGALRAGLNTFTVSNTDVFFVSINLASNAVVELEWIKLEAGTTATAFSPRIYAEEVALCKRFYQVITIYNSEVVCSLHKRDNNKYFGIMHFDAMRAVPTVTRAGNFYIEQYNTSGTFATMEDRIGSIEINAQWEAIRFGITLSTADQVNYLSVSSDSLVFRLDAEIR